MRENMTVIEAIEKAEQAARDNFSTYRKSIGFGPSECGCSTSHHGPCLRKLPVDYDYLPFEYLTYEGKITITHVAVKR